MQATPLPDAAAQKALAGLADIVVPAPVSWMPQTIGWAVVAALLAAATVAWLWRWRQHALANRYRVEALDELAALERQLRSHSRDAALVRIAELIKRTAIAAYSRDAVAQLSGAEWVAFIRQRVPQVPEEAVALLDDLEYRDRTALAAMTDSEMQAIVAATRRWIRGHRVPA